MTLTLTSLIGVWAAYDRRVAWGRFGLIALGLAAAMGIAWAGRRDGERALGWIGLGCAWLAAAIGAYFLLAYDWAAAGPGKFAMIQQAGLWIQAHRPAVPLPEDIHSNVAGGALAILLPPGLGGCIWAWIHRRPPSTSTPSVRRTGSILTLISTLALTLASTSLILTASRGAWIGLAVGAVAAGAFAWHARRRTPSTPSVRRTGSTSALLLTLASASTLALLFWATIALPGFDRLLGNVTASGGSVVSRGTLWRNMLALMGDYLFTGSGLGSTMMVYSTYVLLLHVGFFTHAHNLFLQIAVEQGLPGLAAFLGLLGIASWHLNLNPVCPTDRLNLNLPFRLAAAASLVALVVHGMADAGLYASRLVPVMFLPIGFALAFETQAEVKAKVEVKAKDLTSTLVSTLTLASTLALALLPGTRAAFQANLGAVAQTRAELSVYRWPEWPIQDALRRPLTGVSDSLEVDLGSAIAHYQHALALDPGNVTANRRLGQIELSLGQYESARAHLEAAYAAAPGQQATRQLLGESYAIAGQIERAVALWRTVDVSQGQLALRQWWYGHLGEKQREKWVTEAAALVAEKG